MDYDIPKSVEQCRARLREEFEKNRHVTDIRVIDMLVIKVRVQDVNITCKNVLYTVKLLYNTQQGTRYCEL